IPAHRIPECLSHPPEPEKTREKERDRLPAGVSRACRAAFSGPFRPGTVRRPIRGQRRRHAGPATALRENDEHGNKNHDETGSAHGCGSESVPNAPGRIPATCRKETAIRALLVRRLLRAGPTNPDRNSDADAATPGPVATSKERINDRMLTR